MEESKTEIEPPTRVQSRMDKEQPRRVFPNTEIPEANLAKLLKLSVLPKEVWSTSEQALPNLLSPKTDRLLPSLAKFRRERELPMEV